MLFAGGGEDEHWLPRRLRAAGHSVLALDTKLGGVTHDVLRPELADLILQLVASGAFDAIFAAPPCSSFSVRHPVKLRSAARPEGVQPLPAGWEAYVRKHNRLADFTARVVNTARAAGVPTALENPSWRGEESSPAYWEGAADSGSIFLLESVAGALRDAGARHFTFAQCARAIGGRAQKWTTIAATSWLAAELDILDHCPCEHGTQRHAEQLDGVDELGRSRATLAASYPAGLNRILYRALVQAATARRAAADGTDDAGGQEPATDAAKVGRVAHGHRLHERVRAACEAARSLAPAFSSVRHRDAAPAAALRREAFAGNLFSPLTPSRPASACKARRRRRLPPGVATRARHRDAAAEAEPHAGARAGDAGGGAAAAAELGSGTLAEMLPPEVAVLLPPGYEDLEGAPIEELFLPGVYAGEVLSWLELADAAAAAIRRREPPPHVPTRVIGQDQMAAWARGVVWDCSNPAQCRPVRRSTRHTQFEGRQLDREQVRRVASLLDWQDTDIIDQIGEGGIETRSECSLDTVLTFHHASLLQEVEMAERSVQTHIEEAWADPPVRHLPFVPCRMQPRGVVLQARTRIDGSGGLEEYMKPRITTDASFGGIDSVNYGVPDAERAVALPSAQTLGRGWAICQSAFDGQPADEGGGVRVQGYCIDAESAYSFCPVQEADLWMQCFLWWDGDGRAGTVVDRRMGFGGSFAPNRFERVSTFVAAYTQHLQAEFDQRQPPPVCAQRWTADRRAMQERGELPAGDGQLHPRYLQSFIDDFTGAAADDQVVPPPNVRDIIFAEEHMRAAGCTPAATHTRVRVHAQLTVLALRTLGLAAAPHKVACGSPLPALGLRFDGERRTIDCPAGKRDAILAACAAAHDAAAEHRRVDRAAARRLVGRLCNLSQVEPGLRHDLHAGYAVCEAAWGRRGGHVADADLRLGDGSATQLGWLHLLESAQTLLAANVGVAMAPRRTFPGRDLVGTLTSTTDASGDDGIGGYGFIAGSASTVYMLSESWPPDIRAALQASADEGQAALRRAGAAAAAPSLPMPAAELLVQTLLPALVARHATVRRVFAVGDCQPAVATVNSLHSGNPQMRRLADAAREQPWAWLGVHVTRDANFDADRLSHPAQRQTVAAEAAAAGLTVCWLDVLDEDWDTLREAIYAGQDGQQRRRRKRRRRASTAEGS